MINSFRGVFFFLSNFFPCKIVYLDREFPTSEHLFAACKATNIDDYERIRLAKTPGEAKRLGRTIKCHEDWDDIKVQVMYAIVKMKYEQHPELIEALLLTDNQILAEGNLWHDNFWGNCLCPKCNGIIPGYNHLGRIHMVLRELFKKQLGK